MTAQPPIRSGCNGLSSRDAILLAQLCGVLPTLRDIAEHLGNRVVGDPSASQAVLGRARRQELAERLHHLAEHLNQPPSPTGHGR